MKRLTEFVFSLALAMLILYALLRHFDMRQTADSVRHAHPSLLIISLALLVTAYLLRGWRWRIWQPGLSYWDSLRVILVGFYGKQHSAGPLG